MAATGVIRLAVTMPALLAAGFLAFLAFQGGRPEPGLERFRPAGVLADWPATIAAIEIEAGPAHRSLRRSSEAGWQQGAPAAVPLDLAEQIETGLTLLRNSAPQRVFGPDEVDASRLMEFGLASPRLTVMVRATDGRSMAIRFGGTNPLGLSRYTQIGGRPEVLLLPIFVAEAWERVAGAH